METPKKSKICENEKMEMSCGENDFLVLKEIKIENNAIDCLDESPYLKSIKPSTVNQQVFKLSRKRLQSETESPKTKTQLSSNLFKSKFTSSVSPIVQAPKKWRSASYNPTSSTSSFKMDFVSPLKPIDANIISNYANASSTPNTLIAANVSSMTSNHIPAGISNIIAPNLLQQTNIANKLNGLPTIPSILTQKIDQQFATNLLGDYSNTYALPLISGRHKDLKTISPETLASFMNGDYKSINFTIIDARYPYEYSGGHIDGAINIYHREEINKYFFGVEKPTPYTNRNLILNTIAQNARKSSANLSHNHFINRLGVITESVEQNVSKPPIQTVPSKKKDNLVTSAKSRHAIIFHCEFSSERGPSMCRFLRKIDRELNEHCYPNLYYPEIYLLHGGYKLFFEKFKNLCYPQTYLPMHSSDHKQDLIKFRVKSKSWNGQSERKWRVSNQI